MNKCEHFRRDLASYIMGEISTDRVQEVKQHLEQCPDCRKACEREKRLAYVLGAAAEKAHNEFRDRLVSHLSRDVYPGVDPSYCAEPRGLFGYPSAVGGRLGLAIAAVIPLALVALWVVQVKNQDSEPTVPDSRIAQSEKGDPRPPAHGAETEGNTAGTEELVSPSIPREESGGSKVRPTIFIEGTVILEDSVGDHSSESGTLTLSYPSEDYKEVHVEFVGGRWTSEVPTGSTVTVRHLRIGERYAYPRKGSFQASSSQGVTIRAQWPPDSILQVLGYQTRANLANVEIYRGFRSFSTKPRFLADDRVDLAGTTSPIELPSAPGIQVYWVRVPGYAWDWFEIDQSLGGERSLVLQKESGVLLVSVLGSQEPGPQGRVLELWGAPGSLDREKPVRNARFTFPFKMNETTAIEGIPPGTYSILAWSGAPGKPTHSAKLQTLEVLANDRSDFALNLKEIEDDAQHMVATVHGTLALPEALSNIWLDFYLLDTDRGLLPIAAGLDREAVLPSMIQPDPDDPQVLLWRVDHLLTEARYAVWVRPIGYHEVIEIGKDQTAPVKLVVPELVDVTVAIQDRFGNEVTVECLSWSVDAPLQPVLPLTSVLMDPETRQYTFKAAPGMIRLSVRDSKYRSVTFSPQYSIDPDSNRIVVEVQKALGVQITVFDRDGRDRLAMHDSWWGGVKIHRNGKRVFGEGMKRTRWSMTRYLGEPGNYAFTFQRLEGFEPILPQSIYVSPTQVVQLRIEAIRLP